MKSQATFEIQIIKGIGFPMIGMFMPHIYACVLDEKKKPITTEIIKETLASGVSNFIVAGYSVDSSKKAIEIAEKYDELYAIVRNISKRFRKH